jgi:hypothetical protein
MNTIVTITAPATTFTGAQKGTFPALIIGHTQPTYVGTTGVITPRTVGTLYAQQMLGFARAHKKYIEVVSNGDIHIWMVKKTIPAEMLEEFFNGDKVKIDLFGKEGVGIDWIEDEDHCPGCGDFHITWTLSEETAVTPGNLLAAIENVMRGQQARFDSQGYWSITRSTIIRQDGTAETHYRMTGFRSSFLDLHHKCTGYYMERTLPLRAMLKALWNNRIKVSDQKSILGVGYSQSVQEALNGTKSIMDLAHKLSRFPDMKESDLPHMFNIEQHPMWDATWRNELVKWKEKKSNVAFVSAAYTTREKADMMWLESYVDQADPWV